MPQFADIALPTAVREVFTWHIPDALEASVKPGMRVWVPLQSHMAIGMVVKVHDEKPDFETKPVRKVLDDQPVMPDEILRLTHWVHRFYYAGWGETIQAALPVGLNFISQKILRPGPVQEAALILSAEEDALLNEVRSKGSLPLVNAEQQWKPNGAEFIRQLVNYGLLEIWEEPRTRVESKTETRWLWNEGIGEDDLAGVYKAYGDRKDPKWVQALRRLEERVLPLFRHELEAEPLLNNYTLNRIRKEGLIRAEEVPVGLPEPELEYDPGKIRQLNRSQQVAFQEISGAIDAGEFRQFLIYGVTGSGKTEVYIHALKKVLDSDRGGLVLVPEIALTPQTVRRFYQIFGNTIAVLHSRLSERERYEAWLDLREGKRRVAVGARSAVFAPVRNLGIIIIDEEHDQSYKQEDPAPRYNAREVALMRGYLTKSVVVLGSATPSAISYHSARTGKSTLLNLPERHADAALPAVKVLDLRQYRKAMQGPLTVPLYLAIEEALGKKEQTILLYNRRGFASYIQCEACGHIMECPNCSVSLTYHKAKNHLRCHYCGYTCLKRQQCPQCGEAALHEQGAGTQQIEEDIGALFPEARLLRMDQDTTSGKDAHARILNAFGSGEADILIGTQLISKGLDFPNVTVVGVINSDTELAFPSYRSSERMFQLLSQVAGRSGRSHKKGTVYLQTWQPGHIAVVCARDHDYRKFIGQELEYREQLFYPPFSRLIAVFFKSKDGTRVHKAAEVFGDCLSEAAGGAPILGPSPAVISRMQGQYRWECMLKIDPANGARSIEKMLNRAFSLYQERKPAGSNRVRITVNVDVL